jgi:hypothetical protein
LPRSRRGEVNVKADAISKILVSLGFGAAYQKSREDIFSKYDESKAARADQYLYFLVSNTLDKSTLTDQQKLNAIFQMTSVMRGAPTPKSRPDTGESNRQTPKTALPKSNPAEAAEQFTRLAFKPSTTVNDIIERFHVPHCAEIILSSADDLRLYLENLEVKP